jgi:transcriptional regulator with XRE-family HTH domain
MELHRAQFPVTAQQRKEDIPMVTLAQRISELRAERGISGAALAAALGLPRMTIEKFETGRQTPSQAQQEKLAAYFGVSLFYLRGETTDRTQMSDWMDGAFLDAPTPAPALKKRVPEPVASSGESAQGSMLDALLSGKKFQESLRSAVLDVLRSPEGQTLLADAIRRQSKK